MLEEYYDIITKIENFVDGLMIVDKNGIIKFNKEFHNRDILIDEKKSIGKRPMDIWPNLSAETSTCFRALKYGETSINQIQKLRHSSGLEITVLDNTFPIKKEGEIIGAVSFSQYINKHPENDFIDLPNMTSTHTKNMFRIKDIIGNSEKIQLLKYKIHKLARTNSTVLIYGETGTGKELVAQSIHSESKRKNERFISQNCAAIPNTLLESIFFGTTKGSFTGARNKEGIFEKADGGTIFLDEINSMDLNMQAKLLKAIEEKKITRIGGLESTNTNVRIIAAMNKNPRKCMEIGEMREDLYYRLSSIQINVPTLRERKDDIRALTNYFIKHYNKKMNKNITTVSDEVFTLFYNYNWPGNVRELKNVIEAAFNFVSTNVIYKKDLTDFIYNKFNNEKNSMDIYNGNSLKESVENYEKNFILKKAKNVNSLAELAEKLNISRQSLNYKLKKYSLKFNNELVII